LRLAAKADENIPEILQDAVRLNTYGVEFRYPGDYPEVTRSDAERALQLADLVRMEVRNRLPLHTLE